MADVVQKPEPVKPEVKPPVVHCTYRQMHEVAPWLPASDTGYQAERVEASKGDTDPQVVARLAVALAASKSGDELVQRRGHNERVRARSIQGRK